SCWLRSRSRQRGAPVRWGLAVAVAARDPARRTSRRPLPPLRFAPHAFLTSPHLPRNSCAKLLPQQLDETLDALVALLTSSFGAPGKPAIAASFSYSSFTFDV